MHAEKNRYTWAELSDRAKDRAREYFDPDHEWWDGVYDNFKEDMKPRGFEVTDIFFRGFCCQGSYAAWTGVVDCVVWCDKRYEETKEMRYMIAAALFHEVYAHRIDVRSRGISSRLDDIEANELSDDAVLGGTGWTPRYPLLDGMNVNTGLEAVDFYALHTEIQEDINATCSDLFKRLEEEYEYMTSDEYLAELCDGNDYLFNEEGEML